MDWNEPEGEELGRIKFLFLSLFETFPHLLNYSKLLSCGETENHDNFMQIESKDHITLSITHRSYSAPILH